MKFISPRTIKRSLLLLLGSALLGLGFTAFSHERGRGWSEADKTQLREKMLARAGERLELSAEQRQHLDALLKTLAAQHTALTGPAGAPRQQLQDLVSGPSFDQAAAKQLVEGKTALLREKAPELITAMARFYDSLKPEQQAELRELLASRGRHGWRG